VVEAAAGGAESVATGEAAGDTAGEGKARAVEPATALRKRALIVERGRFDTIAPYQSEMLRASRQRLRAGNHGEEPEAAAVLEMTVHDATGAPPPDDRELLARVDRLAQLGAVVVSDFAPYFELIHYLRRYTAERIRVVVGVPALANLLGEQFYDSLPGALLEGLGKLLDQGVKIYAYPVSLDVLRAALGTERAAALLKPGAPGPTGLVTADDLRPPPPPGLLLDYLRAAGWIVPLDPQT